MNELIIVITGILGATLTYYVSEQLKQGPVRSSALLSLIVGLFFYCFPEILSQYLANNIPLVFIGASFIGMVSAKVKVNYLSLVIAGFLFSTIYLGKSDFFEGYGGALGAMAFIALLTIMVLGKVVSRNKPGQ